MISSRPPRIGRATPADRLSQRRAFCNVAAHRLPKPRSRRAESPKNIAQMLAWLKTKSRSPANSTLSLWLDCDPGARARLLRRRGACPTPLQGRFEMIALHLVLVAAPAGRGGPGGRAPGKGPDRGIRGGSRRCHARDDLWRSRRAPGGQARRRRPLRPPPRLSCGARRGRRYERSRKRSGPSSPISAPAQAWMRRPRGLCAQMRERA